MNGVDDEVPAWAWVAADLSVEFGADLSVGANLSGPFESAAAGGRRGVAREGEQGLVRGLSDLSGSGGVPGGSGRRRVGDNEPSSPPFG